MARGFAAALGHISKSVQANLETITERTRDRLAAEMQDIAEGGEFEMRRIIEISVTDTGLKRAERGGHPGRIETGEMIDSVTHDVTIERDRITAEWGWISNAHTYFLEQEHGTAQIAAMDAIGQSLEISEQDLIAKLDGF